MINLHSSRGVLARRKPIAYATLRDNVRRIRCSGKDRGKIPQEWFDNLITSDYHDMLLAIDDNGQIIGIATLSIIMGPIVRRVAYLEDFVTDTTVRGQGVGSKLWDAILDWARSKQCTELNFTSGHGREAAQAFYQKRGAKVYDTNFFRLSL